jgi:ribosomal protein L18
MRRFFNTWPALAGLALILAAAAANAADSLDWRVKQGQVDADIQSWNVSTLLKKIARLPGWKVYVEKGADAAVSVKFKNLSEDEALHRLLGDLNYAKDKTNGVTRLLVFRTAAKAATQIVAPEKRDYRILNEDLVKLKKGATNSIDDMAKALGAKVVGRDDRIGLYRLQFADAAGAAAGLQALASDPSVAAADGNYVVERPTPAQMTQVPNGSGPLFNLNPQPAANGPIVGLVDTSVDPPAQFSQYMLKAINVTGQTDTPADMPSHGTGMLETLLAAMPSDPSKILPVDVYGNSPTTTTFEVMEGLVAAINAGANPINLSLGGTGQSTMLGDLISEAVQRNPPIVILAAAGNTPGEGDVYPASYPGVISVTASTQTVNGPITATAGGNAQLASYANDPPGTRVIAPGTSYVQWNGQTWVVEGTSPATASTTGTIAGLATQNGISLTQAAALVTRVSPAPAK